MYHNPFTPESQKAKKSLFNKRPDLTLSKTMVEKVESADPLTEYLDQQMKKSQVLVLKDFVKSMIKLNSKQGGIINSEAQIENVFKRHAKLDIDTEGNIISIDLSTFNLDEIPLSIRNLKKIKKLDLSQCLIREFAKAVEPLSNLEELFLFHNPVDWSQNLEPLKNLKNLNKLAIHGSSAKPPKEIEEWFRLNLPNVLILL